MVRTEEIHGLFQCLDISTSEEDSDSGGGLELNFYEPTVAKEGWFMDDEELKREAVRLKNLKWANPKDFTVAKYQIDLLYFQKRYLEAFKLALASFEYHKHGSDLRREIVDILVRCVLGHPEDERPRDLLEECAEWFDGRLEHVKDTGLCWLRVAIAAALGDWEGGIRTCDAFLEIRPGDLCLWERKKDFALQLGNKELLKEINKTIRILEHNLTR